MTKRAGWLRGRAIKVFGAYKLGFKESFMKPKNNIFLLCFMSCFFIVACSQSGNFPIPTLTKRASTPQKTSTSSAFNPRSVTTKTPKPSATKTSRSSSGWVGDSLVIPRKPQVAPVDVFDQFAFGGRGGAVPGEPAVAKFDEYILLSSYSPNQEVRILLYKAPNFMKPGIFYAEFKRKVGKDGSLTLYIENGKGTDFNYVVLDEKTNKEITPKENHCPKLSWSQLSVNTTARITFTNGTPLRLRDSAIHGNVIKSFDEGTQLKIESGPLCSDNYIWWEVTIKGKHGWMAEGDGSDRFLEPLP